MQSVAEPVDHEDHTSKDVKGSASSSETSASSVDWAKEADKNREDWERKRTDEIRKEEEKKAEARAGD